MPSAMRSPSRTGLGVATTSVMLGLATSATAVAPTPAGLNPGDHFHLVFVTSGTIAADSINIGDYDALVAAEASAAGLNTYNSSPITWQALASTEGGVNAIDRFNPTAATYRLDGSLVANNGADLWDSSISNSISITPTLTTYEGRVWTGTNGAGQEDKGLGVDPALYGLATATDVEWINGGNTATTDLNALYAFSSELVVPPLPEPASVGLLGMLASLLGLRRR